MPPVLDPASYHLGLASVPTALAMLAIFGFGVATLVRERISLVSLSLFLVALTVSLWLFAQSGLYAAADDRVALAWARATYLGVPFIAPATYQFTVVVLRRFARERLILAAAWTGAAILAIVALRTDLILDGLYHYWWGPYQRFNGLGILLVLFTGGLLAASMGQYLVAYRRTPAGIAKRRIGALMIAFGIGYVSAVDFVPTYGVPVYPFGYLGILGFVGLATWAIYRYRLVDITPAFAANQIVDTMTDALLVCDPQGVVRVANQAAGRLFGTPRATLLGRPLATLLEDPFFADPARFAELLQVGKMHNHELAHAPAGGAARILSFAASVMCDAREQPVAVVLIGRDITARRRAEEQVRHQNAYLAALHETSLGLMRRLDLEDLLEVIIGRAASLLGTEHGYIYVAEADGSALTVRAGTGVFVQDVGAQLAPGEGLAGRVWQSGAPLAVPDYRNWHGQAGRFAQVDFHAVVGVPLRSGTQTTGVLGLAYLEEGRAFGEDEIDLLLRFAQLAAIALDNARLYSAAQEEVAERRRAEAEVKRLNDDLERRVAERTAQLEAALKELEGFSYSVSHDLRAPLRAVTGFSNAVLEDYADQLDAPGRRYLGLIRENAANMGQLIDDLLAFSRLGRQPMARTTIQLDQLARAVFDELQVINPGRVIEFTVEPLPPAFGDRAMIHQVLANLLSNAVKFTRHRDPACIHVGALVQDGETVYYVQDNGAGFDMQYAHKLFGVFQRLHTTSEFEGTGVGLALVQRIVGRHGGRIWAESQVGAGATFYVTLPHEGANL